MKNDLDMKIQNYKETDAVMEIQPQRKTEITLKAVEYEPQLDKLNMESSECSQSKENPEATMKTNKDNRVEEIIMGGKIKARGKVTLSSIQGKQTLSFTINKFTPPYPTTAAVDEDHLDRSRFSPIQVSNVLTDNKQRKAPYLKLHFRAVPRIVPGYQNPWI